MKSGPLEASEAHRAESIPTQGVTRGVSILDLILRIFAICGTLGSAIAMGTTDQTLPFVTQFSQFRAQYNDLPAFTFFVIANSIVCAYLAFSLLLSVFHIVMSRANTSRAILIVLDTVMLALLTSGASAATAIVYLAHEGNASANWSAICQQYDSFCEQFSGSLIGSFASVIMFIVLILFSAISISRHQSFLQE